MKAKQFLLVGAVSLLAGTSLSFATETPLTELPSSQAQMSVIGDQENAPIQIIVSRKDQTLRVYRGLEEIAQSKVSTGKRGHTTPTGIFSILEKRKRHFSNLYNSAPMPYMQRLTWSGIALHESNSVPNYPASHGCVRLPRGFAKKLFGLTERGAHVIIANREAAPQRIEHDLLFQPADESLANRLSMLDTMSVDTEPGLGKIALLSTRPSADPAHAIARQLNKYKEIRASNKPLRIFITRQAKGNLVKEIQQMLNQLGYNSGVPDGIAGKDTMSAVKAFLDAKKGSIESRHMSMKPVINQALLQDLYSAAGKGDVPTGHLFVRHNFKPLFDIPIQISKVDQPLGAHLFTATQASGDQDRLIWQAVNLGDKFSEKQQDRLGVSQNDDHSGIVASHDVLDRIIMPEAVKSQISMLVSNGASLTISDRGISRETTPQGTDFIVLTKPTAPSAEAIKTAKAKAVVKRKKVAKKPKVLQEVKPAKKKTLFSLFRKPESRQAAN